MNPSWKELISSYRYSAKKRNLEWSLTNEEAIELFTSDCEYCGAPPLQSFNPYARKTQVYKLSTIAKNWISYNGIDRIDNEKGYFLLNCCPCCGICNKAKRNLTIEEFETWIQRLVDKYKGDDF